MKNIDIKSLIIGALLTSTIFLGVAATSLTDKWDDRQEWEIFRITTDRDTPQATGKNGYEPFAVSREANGKFKVHLRRRIK